ncbi:hypothetical protein IAT38_001882 [Cryptococcus sp. DSM 104549]
MSTATTTTTSHLPKHVVIIGGGLGGCAFAVALARAKIPSTIYEIRSSPGDIGGSLMLAPNALCVLDKVVGIEPQIRAVGFEFEKIDMFADGGKLGGIIMGDKEKWGYNAVRVNRPVLHDVLLKKCGEYEEVKVVYGKTWERMEEGELGVKVFFTDGSIAEGDIVVGADGIHSQVRRHILGDSAPSPTYTGSVSVGGVVPRSSLNLPPGMQLPAFVYTPPGMVMMIPIGVAGQQIDWSAQRTEKERSRAGWREYEHSGEAVKAVKADYHGVEEEPIKSIVANARVGLGEGRVWAPYEIPDLPTWHSKRVCLIGDAAHAVSPAGGQGSAAAFEDGAFLARLLADENAMEKGYEALFKYYEQVRRRRLEEVKALTKASGSARVATPGRLAWAFRKWAMWGFFLVQGGYMRTDTLMGYDVTTESIKF